jgi:hypothetical protein
VTYWHGPTRDAGHRRVRQDRDEPPLTSELTSSTPGTPRSGRHHQNEPNRTSSTRTKQDFVQLYKNPTPHRSAASAGASSWSPR